MKQFLAATLCILTAKGAFACNVPVFRYALERWQSDSFAVTLYHRGAISSNEQAVVTALRQASDNDAANFSISAQNLPGPTNFPLPWLVVDYPAARGLAVTAWKGPFTPETGRLLVDSPARRELVRRLASGDSVVWILLDGDKAAEELLGRELRKLEKEITLPEVDPDDPRTEGNVKLKIAFSVLPVSRRDAAENVFVSMMLNVDPDLARAAGPVAFPFFGRGRMLTGLAGKNLSAENIGEVSLYLCGACSCEIKEQNPGFDMLLAADWDAAVTEQAVKDPPLPPMVSLSTLAAAARTQPRPEEPAAAGNLRRNLLFVLGGILCVVVLGALAMAGKRRQ